MRWTSLGFVGALSFSGASASANAVLGAKLDVSSGLLPEYRQAARMLPRNATTPNLLSRFLSHIQPRQNEGRCGADFGGQRCTNQQCCSAYGYCGNEPEFCGEIVGCQPAYGRCGNAPEPEPSSTPIPSSTPPPVSSTPMPTPTPTPSSSVVPSSSRVVSSSSSSFPPLPSGSLIPSVNGACGNVTTCAGSGFGRCCSEWYYCGNSIDYCGTGCRSGFGACDGGNPPISSSSTLVVPSTSSTPPPIPSSSSTPPPVPSSSSTPVPTSTPPPRPSSTSTPTPSPTSSSRPVPTVPVSQDGKCGNGISCTGSTYGRCCSDYGWCGSQEEYCRPAFGCQPEWGECGVLGMFEGM